MHQPERVHFDAPEPAALHHGINPLRRDPQLPRSKRHRHPVLQSHHLPAVATVQHPLSFLFVARLQYSSSLFLPILAPPVPPSLVTQPQPRFSRQLRPAASRQQIAAVAKPPLCPQKHKLMINRSDARTMAIHDSARPALRPHRRPPQPIQDLYIFSREPDLDLITRHDLTHATTIPITTLPDDVLLFPSRPGQNPAHRAAANAGARAGLLNAGPA